MQDNAQWTELYQAIMAGQEEAALSLIHGARGDQSVICARGEGDVTPLMLASGVGIRRVMEALIAAGADVSESDHEDRRAFDHAMAAGREDAGVLLVGAMESMTNEGIYWAVEKGMTEVFKAFARMLRATGSEEADVADIMGLVAIRGIIMHAAGRLAVLKTLEEEGLDLTRWRVPMEFEGNPWRGHPLIYIALEERDEPVLAYLCEAAARAEQEAEAAAAEAVAVAEQEAKAAAEEAARLRARNERRRQEQKRAKARLREAAGAAGNATEDATEEEEEEQGEGEQQQEQEELAAALAGMQVGAVPEALAEPDALVVEAAAPVAHEQEGQADTSPLPPPLAPVIAPPPPLAEFLEANAPESLLCPITLHLLDDPVVLMADGSTYSRAAIEQHFAYCRQHHKPLTSPATNLEIDPALALLTPVFARRGVVQDYKEAKTREWEAAEQRWHESVKEGTEDEEDEEKGSV